MLSVGATTSRRLGQNGDARVTGVVSLCLALALLGCGTQNRASQATTCSTSDVVRTVQGPAVPNNPRTAPSSDNVLGGVRTYRAMSLTRVTVGRSGSRLCVDFHAKGPLDDAAFYELVMDRAGPHRGGLGVKLQVWLQAGQPRITLRYPGDQQSRGGIYVSGHVHRSGSDTTVLIERSAFPRWWPFVHFRFHANGVARGAPTAPFQQYAVTIPTRPAGFP